MSHLVLIIVFSLLMLPGIIGILVPVLPGIPFMFAVALIAAFIERFQYLSSRELLILGLIALVSLLVDYFSGVLGARFGGASKGALYYGFLGLIIGVVIFPPLGGIIGLFIGIFIAEMAQKRSRSQAARAAAGGVIGSLAGMMVNLVLSLAFIVLFVVFALK